MSLEQQLDERLLRTKAGPRISGAVRAALTSYRADDLPAEQRVPLILELYRLYRALESPAEKDLFWKVLNDLDVGGVR